MSALNKNAIWGESQIAALAHKSTAPGDHPNVAWLKSLIAKGSELDHIRATLVINFWKRRLAGKRLVSPLRNRPTHAMLIEVLETLLQRIADMEESR